MNKKQKKLLGICVALSIILCFMVLFILLGGVEIVRQYVFYFKAPSEYTWDEYQAMDNEAQDELFHRFDSLEDFEAWKESVQPTQTEPVFQWNEPGKLPSEYTWEEFEALNLEQKEAFYQWFASTTEFESWMNQAKPAETTFPNPTWTEEKQPDKYTWDEYQALSPEDQDAFFLWFSSKETFEAWMNDAKSEGNKPSAPIWNQPGKKPNEYTWDEYQALSPVDQDAFYHWFGSIKEFETWMDAVQSDGNENASWSKPGKKPDEYTWAEYQALTPEDQDLFYLWFTSRDAFEAWLEQAEK